MYGVDHPEVRVCVCVVFVFVLYVGVHVYAACSRPALLIRLHLKTCLCPKKICTMHKGKKDLRDKLPSHNALSRLQLRQPQDQ